MRTQMKTAMTGNNKYWVVLRKISLGSTPYYDVSAHNQSLTSLDAGITQMFGSLEGAEAFFEHIMEDNKAPMRIIRCSVTGNKKYVVNHTLHGGTHHIELREAGINGKTVRLIKTPYLARAHTMFERMMADNEAPKAELIKSELTPNKKLNVQMWRLNGRYTVSTSSTEGLCVQMRHFDSGSTADIFWRSVMRLNGPAPKAEPKAEPLLDRIKNLERRVGELTARAAGSVVPMPCPKTIPWWQLSGRSKREVMTKPYNGNSGWIILMGKYEGIEVLLEHSSVLHLYRVRSDAGAVDHRFEDREDAVRFFKELLK